MKLLVVESFLNTTDVSALQENSKRWTMKLDICAPQVIFPDDFQSGDPMLVVVDLGRILLTNSQGKTINLFTKRYTQMYSFFGPMRYF